MVDRYQHLHHQGALVVLEGLVVVLLNRLLDFLAPLSVSIRSTLVFFFAEALLAAIFISIVMTDIQGTALPKLLGDVCENLVVHVDVFWSSLLDASVLPSCNFDFVYKSPFLDGQLPLLLGGTIPYLKPYLTWPCGLLDLREPP